MKKIKEFVKRFFEFREDRFNTIMRTCPKCFGVFWGNRRIKMEKCRDCSIINGGVNNEDKV